MYLSKSKMTPPQNKASTGKKYFTILRFIIPVVFYTNEGG